MSPDTKSTLNRTVYEQAAEWLIELRDGEVDATLRERLDAWFRESPLHIRAYLELSAVWEDGADPDLDRAHTTEQLIALGRETSNIVVFKTPDIGGAESRALERSGNAPEGIVAPPPPSETAPLAESRTSVPRRRLGAAWAAAAVLVCGALGFSVYVYQQRNLSFVTETGEQHFVKLIDGSTLELNSRSRVRIRFSQAQRDVDLLEGQALFHVAKDSARPFIVHSDSTEVRAVGTQFDVYRKETGTIVTVVEGRVAVVSPLLTHEPREIDRHARVTHASGSGMPHVPSSKLTSTPEQGGASGSGVVLPDPALLSSERDAVFLDADEQLSVSAGASREPIHTDSAAATAWTQHEIVFASTPLSEVATEFNRYNTRPLVIPNAAVRGIHITGVFSSADAAPLLKFLRAQHDIAVQETDEDIRILKK